MSIEYLNDCIQREINPNIYKVANHNACYIKALLEAQFSPRKFTYSEVQELLLEEFPKEADKLK